MRLFTFFLMLHLVTCILQAQNSTAKSDNESFTVESYYKIKWGHADEFLALYKKNHYPLLKKAMEHNDILLVKVEKPRLHSGEETRWDFRVTVIFKNMETAYNEDLLAPYKTQLFPKQKQYIADEQQRFELIVAHWDVTPAKVILDSTTP